MTLLTYNTWHGLDAKGVLRFGDLEPRGRRERRYAIQSQLFKSTSPDLLFLQEVSPVAERSAGLARELGYDEVHQPDQIGIKVAGVGIPQNLNCGLAILAKPPLKMRFEGAVKLSGPPGIVGDRWSFQAAEFRFALFASVDWPEVGRVLVANLHLHHGVEMTTKFAQKLLKAESEDILLPEQKHEIEKVLGRAGERRAREIQRFLNHVESVRSQFAGVVVAGDLNSTVEGPAWHALMQMGFVDVFQKCHPQDTDTFGYSWNPERNAENHGFAQKFNLPVPAFEKKAIEQLHREHDRRLRRIDFIFASAELAARAKDCRLFATDDVDGLVPSDHYGVLAHFDSRSR